MPRRPLLALPLLFLLLLVGCKGNSTVPQVVDPALSESTTTLSAETSAAPLAKLRVKLELVLDGFKQPLFVTGTGKESSRLIVLEKSGIAWVVENGARSRVFLDLTDAVSTQSERGLLGMAFSPDYATDHAVYVDYTDLNGTTTISRFIVQDGVVNRASESTLLTIKQPYTNHNGGMIGFGPDEYLYIGMGDGGDGGDPEGNGQNLGTLLGAILRIDVAGNGDYTVPADNPFASTSGARPEIWAYGLRNPWRYSFDRLAGDMWIGDVGQNKWEEIDFQPASATGGENYGWNKLEAAHGYPPTASAPAGDFTMPVIEYDHDAGESVTGGYVYRGTAFPQMQGTYLYGDFVSGTLWGAQRAADGTLESRTLLQTELSLVSFGEGDDGELYVLDFSGGALYHVVAE